MKNNRLTSIEITNFKAIQELDLDIPQNSNFVFITGENGSGKSTLLEAMFLGITGFKAHSSDYKLSLSISNTNDNTVLKENVIFFHQDKTTAESFEIGLNGDMLSQYFIGDLSFDNILKNRFTLICKVLSELMPELLLHFDTKTCKIMFTNDSNEISEMNFSSLSFGERYLFDLIGNIVLSLPNNGIVLIDEIETYLHPKMQRKLVSILASAFPDIQFIVSTNSPIILLGAPNETAIFRMANVSLEGIVIEKIDVNIVNFTPNILYSSPIFGLYDIFSSNAKAKDIRTEDSYAEMVKNDERRKRLAEHKFKKGELDIKTEQEFDDEVSKRVNEFLSPERAERLKNILEQKTKGLNIQTYEDFKSEVNYRIEKRNREYRMSMVDKSKPIELNIQTEEEFKAFQAKQIERMSKDYESIFDR